MKLVAFGILSLLIAACSGKHDGVPFSANGESRIFGGPIAYGTQYAPYAAILSYKTSKGTFTCTATPILPSFMLVSAHCLVDASELKVLFFAPEITQNVLTQWPQEYTRSVKNHFSHPRYGNKVAQGHGNPNDIAVLQLDQPMPQGMQTFALNSVPVDRSKMADVGIIGYGYEKIIRRTDGTMAAQGREYLRFATQPLLPGGDAGMFLLDGHQGQGTCAGDSGGAVFQVLPDGKYVLVALTTVRLTISTQADQCAVDSLALDIAPKFKWIVDVIRYLNSPAS